MKNEIDLGEIIPLFLKVAKQKIVFIILFFAISFASSFYLYNNQQPEFSSSAFIYWNSEFNSNANKIIGNLNSVLASGDTKNIIRALNISEEDASKITSISLEPDYSNRNFFVVSITSNNEEFDLPEFEKGLLIYLKENPFIKDLRDSEINRFKNIVDYIVEKEKNINSITDSNGRVAESISLEMQELKAESQHHLKRLEFTLTQNFTSLSKINRSKAYILGALFISFALSFLMIIAIVIKNKEFVVSSAE